MKHNDDLLIKRTEIYCYLMRGNSASSGDEIMFRASSNQDESQLVTLVKARAMQEALQPFLGSALYIEKGTQEYRLVIPHACLEEKNLLELIQVRIVLLASMAPAIDVEVEKERIKKSMSLASLHPDFQEESGHLMAPT